MATALITVEGVLRDPAGLPISEGVRLLHGLSESHTVVLGSEDVDYDQRWLKIEGIPAKYSIVSSTPLYLRGGDYVLGQVESLLGGGHDLTLVVTPDPSKAALIMHRGVTALLFAHPRFSRPEYRPDHQHTVRPWDELVGEIETQRVLEASLESE